MLEIVIMISGWSNAKSSEGGERHILAVDWSIVYSIVIEHANDIAYIKGNEYITKHLLNDYYTWYNK